MSVRKLWNKPPKGIRLDCGSIHIWLVEIDKEKSNLEYFSSILSNNELEEANRFIFERDRVRYIVTHGILRLVLSRYVQMNPELLCFSAEKKGKPLIGQAEFSRVKFNLSHSGKYIIYAVADNRDMGIDIEYIKDFPVADKIVERFFSRKEAEEFFGLPAEIRQKAFFTCWTRKEAFIKAVGDGLFCPLNSFSVSPDPDIRSGIEIDNVSLKPRQWTLEDIRLEDEDYVSAIASEGEIKNLICYKYE